MAHVGIATYDVGCIATKCGTCERVLSIGGMCPRVCLCGKYLENAGLPAQELFRVIAEGCPSDKQAPAPQSRKRKC